MVDIVVVGELMKLFSRSNNHRGYSQQPVGNHDILLEITLNDNSTSLCSRYHHVGFGFLAS